MIKSLILNGRSCGSTIDLNHALMVFCNREIDEESLLDAFPELWFCFLKQVHGKDVVPADQIQRIAADGHFTNESDLALVSQTADCVPVLLSGPKEICALHAGWRGVAANIVEASKNKLKESPTVAAIGPHIRKANFEVGLDVVAQLMAAAPEGTVEDEFTSPHKDNSKKYFDLTKLVKMQLTQTFPGIQIYDTGENTFTDPQLHSYRRDKDQAGRLYSFVMLKSGKFV